MVASGNDFIIVERYPLPATRYPDLAKKICNRKYGAGADGLLVLGKSRVADIKMRIFNVDGSEAQMCGNGARCVAFYIATRNPQPATLVTIETKAGIIRAQVKRNDVKVKLTGPKNIKLDIAIRINGRQLHVNFINTGVPHAVIFVEGLDKIDVVNIGRNIRYHKRFLPQGTNVDFVEIQKDNSIKLRTYERGVEDETLACGTGAVASALIVATRYPQPLPVRQAGTTRKSDVVTTSAEVLKVYFDKINNKFKDVWLEGKVKIVYEGEYYV